MITRTVTIDESNYTLKPMTRKQFREVQAMDKDTLIDIVLALVLPDEVATRLDDQPFYVSKQLFDEAIDLTTGGKAEKN